MSKSCLCSSSRTCSPGLLQTTTPPMILTTANTTVSNTTATASGRTSALARMEAMLPRAEAMLLDPAVIGGFVGGAVALACIVGAACFCIGRQSGKIAAATQHQQQQPHPGGQSNAAAAGDVPLAQYARVSAVPNALSDADTNYGQFDDGKPQTNYTEWNENA